MLCTQTEDRWDYYSSTMRRPTFRCMSHCSITSLTRDSATPNLEMRTPWAVPPFCGCGAMWSLSQVFIPDKEECFRVCTVKENKGGQIVSFDESYKTYSTPSTEAFPVNPDHMSGVSAQRSVVVGAACLTIRETSPSSGRPPSRRALTNGAARG